jgi:hypothetical protein
MLTRLLLLASCVLCVAFGAPLSPLPPPCSVQETDHPDKLPAIKAKLEKLSKLIAKRGEQDVLAVHVIEELEESFDERGPKDRAAIVKALGRCLSQKRKALENGKPTNSLYVPAARALGVMGHNATKVLAGWVDHKQHRTNLVLRRELILSLGMTKDPAAVKTLTGLLNYDSDKIMAWSASALSEFSKAPSKLRKEIFSEVIKVLVTASEQKEDGGSVEAGIRWETIKLPMLRCLSDLSAESQEDAAGWQRWWNKNKREDWS